MPLPVAHGLIGASAVAALLPFSRSRIAKPLLIGAFLGISPDFDYALNWLRISGGGWHHGFTHSIPFALFIGLLTIVVLREWKVRSFIVFSAAFGSHTLLDYLITESRGVALWWPFTDHRYKLRLPNPIDYSSIWETTMEMIKVTLTELFIFAPVLLAIVLIRRVLMKRSRLKASASATISVFVVTFLTATPAFSQDKKRSIHWQEAPIAAGAIRSSTYKVIPQIDVLEIVDFAIGGKSITIGESFTADEEWLQNLTVRIKNVSQGSISTVQLNFFLPQLMPGGPMVTLCYGCGDVGFGKIISPGEEVELKIAHYRWLTESITAKGSLAEIDKAEIQNMIVTPVEGKPWFSSCVKTTKPKNACVPVP